MCPTSSIVLVPWLLISVQSQDQTNFIENGGFGLRLITSGKEGMNY